MNNNSGRSQEYKDVEKELELLVRWQEGQGTTYLGAWMSLKMGK